MTILCGDVFDILPTLEPESVNCVVTSPPYWGLRDYGTDGQLGLEPTPDEYVAKMVAVFREVWRVLRDDGTLWLNLGDSYAGSPAGTMTTSGPLEGGGFRSNKAFDTAKASGLKPKDLCGIPWRVAFALQADGWYLRSDIIWSKPNPMPESVTDRPTKAHEYLFLMTKNARYYYDSEAIKEPCVGQNAHDTTGPGYCAPGQSPNTGSRGGNGSKTRNRRSVWTVTTQPYKGAHFATYPEKLVEPCVLAGCPSQVCAACGAPYVRVRERVSTGRRYSTGKSEAKNKAGLATGFSGYDDGSSGPVYKTIGWDATCTCNADTVPGTVLDPFTGSGTTGAVACRLGRNFVGIELNPEYIALCEKRIAKADIP